ncbi:urokinase plasminogen activator surface receptor-like [Rhinatrema bivittatum]|uniref:urokinase plasminogen activator surface receptor-like n=1 Tax=Rhinatrema bivittatum TaxID=194408 RepID=UPI0011269BFC|nr:urokinase plasminogen activator surface receptor-like [Rhinatrema bivittatum]
MTLVWRLLALCALLQTGKSLDCYECFGPPYNCKETVRTCYMQQTSCIWRAYTYITGNKTIDQLEKGCSQGLICNESAYVNQGNTSLYSSSACCTSSLCNAGMYYAQVRVSHLQCYACQGNIASCSTGNLPTLQCAGVQDRCVDITSVTLNGMNRMETVLKGCGTGDFCSRKINFNTGNTSTYTSVQCCGSANCNTALPTVSLNDTPNGLQCYACNETGKGECLAANIRKVNCTGQMTQCVDVVGFPRGQTMLRGCCSEQACLGLSATLTISASQKLHCCTGNLCNNGVIAGYYTQSSGGRASQYHTLPLWLAVLITVTILYAPSSQGDY